MKKLLFFTALSLGVFFCYTLEAQVVKVVNNKVGVGFTNPTYKMQINGDVYANWIRTVGTRGMYSQTYGTYLQPTSTSYWGMRSDRGMSVRSRANTIRGYIYHNNANGFGLLDGDGNWGMRIERDNYTRFSINNIIRMTIHSNGRTEFPNGGDATGGTNTGHIEVANTLRIDGNEMITNTGNTLYLQNDNNGDLLVDGGSLHVDASLNRTYVRSLYDKDNGSYYVNPSSISRVAFMYPLSDNAGYCGSSASTWGYGYFNRLYRTYAYTLSDRRAKENIENISGALGKIMQLQGQRYQYKKEYVEQQEPVAEQKEELSLQNPQTVKGQNDNKAYIDNKAAEGEEGSEPLVEITVVTDEVLDHSHIESSPQDLDPSIQPQSGQREIPVSLGFMAQDVQRVVPEAVDYDEVNDVYALSYTSLIPLLVEGMKEQQEMILKQQEEIEKLKELINK